jgi:S-adenosylmethionine:tRNA ribosyltransferase-isomerase
MSEKHSNDLSDFLSDYRFDVPSDLIAQEPSDKREDAKLLLVRRNPTQGLPQFEDLLVSDLPQVISENPSLQKSDWLRNRSRVFPARFYARRPSVGKHEIVLLESLNQDKTLWKAIIRGSGDF